MKSESLISLSSSENGCSARIESLYFPLGDFIADLGGCEPAILETLSKCDEILAGSTPRWTFEGNTCELEMEQDITKITDGLYYGIAVSIPTEQFRMLVDCWLAIVRSSDGKKHVFRVDLEFHPPSDGNEQTDSSEPDSATR